MNGPIIVPLDGSQLAEQTLPYGIVLAKYNSTSLVLLRAIPLPREPVPLASGGTLTVDEQLEILRADSEDYLRERVKIVSELDVTVEMNVVVGNPPDVIAETADALDAGCVAIATHGRSGLSRWALGSVTDRVLHLTSCPLLVMRPHDVRDLDVRELPVLDRLLVPLDGSQLSEEALPYATDLARSCHSELYLFRVITLPASGLAGLEAGVIESVYWETAREEAGDYLERLATELAADGVQTEYSIGTEPVAEEILSFAEHNAIDLIVMTTHAREGLSRLILGSVTDRIIRAGQVPVFVIRPTEE